MTAPEPTLRDELTPSEDRAVRLALEVAALRAKVARVEALADEWGLTEFPDEGTANLLRFDLRAALRDQP